MRSPKDFREFLEDGTVKKRGPDRNRAESLIREVKAKKLFLETVIKVTPKEKIYPNFVIDSCYDIIIEMVRARMLLEGYSSDSYEAEVSYMAILGFALSDIRFADGLRWYRNGIKYYGKMMDMEYADKVLAFLNRIYPELEKIVQPY